MKFSSATVVTIVSLLGSFAATLSTSADPHLALAGMCLAAVYTAAHALLNRPKAAPAPAPVAAPAVHDSASVPGYTPPVAAHLTVVPEAAPSTPKV